MDFIPKISRKSKHSKSGGSKLSLRSRKQFSLSQSQSYTQEVTEGPDNETFSQPMPSNIETEQSTENDIFAEFSLLSRHKLRGASKSTGEKRVTFDLSKDPPEIPKHSQEVIEQEKPEQRDTFDLSKYPDSPPNVPTPEEIQVIDLASTPEEEEEEMQQSPVQFGTQESAKNVGEKESTWQSPKKNFSCVQEKQSPKKHKEDLTRIPKKNVSVVEKENEKKVTKQNSKKNLNLVEDEIMLQSPKKNEKMTGQSPKKSLSPVEDDTLLQSPRKYVSVDSLWTEKSEKQTRLQSPRKNVDLVEKRNMCQSPKKNATWQSPKKGLSIPAVSPDKYCKEVSPNKTDPSPKKFLSSPVVKEQSPEKNWKETSPNKTDPSPKKIISSPVVKEQSPEKNWKETSPNKTDPSPKKFLSSPVVKEQSPEKNWKETSPNKTDPSPKKHVNSKPDLDKIKLLKVSREESETKKSKCRVEAAERADPKSKFASMLNVGREESETKKSKCSVEAAERADPKSKFASKLQVFSKPEAKKLTLAEDGEKEEEQDAANESMDFFRDGPETKVAEKLALTSMDKPTSKKDGPETKVAGMDKPTSKKDRPVQETKNQAPPSMDKRTSEENTESAESLVSLDKLEELPCPICNKPAGKNRRAHMKSCAVKNEVSTKQLLKAIELQERQAAERRALGLPPAGLHANQKVFVKKKSRGGSSKDAGVELALALSRSLQEAQEQEELRRVRELIGEQEAFGWQATASQAEMVANAIAPEPQPSTSGAQLILGPGSDGVVQLRRGNTARRGRGRNVAGPPPLLLTTRDEERERRITEKVAMLLVGDENPTASDTAAERLPIPPLSSRLRKLQNESSTLWSLTAVSPSKQREAFYVANISEFVSPTKHEPGAALRHLSQIPGRNRSPNKSSEATDMSLCSFVESNAWLPPPSTSMDMSSLSPVNGRSRLPTGMSSTSPLKCRGGGNARPAYKSGGNALSSAWRGLLNNRTMSDVTVYVRGEHALRAHKLVLYARCPAMLEDIAKDLSPGSDRVREQMLLWSDVSRAAALAMLEFIYCDTTERATTLLQEHLEQLTQLARRYKVKELLQHLLMLTKIRSCVTESPSNKFPKPHSSPSLTPKTTDKSPSSVLRPRSNSPDLFTEQKESSMVEYERPDLEYLVSMMEKSQVDSESAQSIRSSLSSPRTVEVKRKCSESPNVFAMSAKKHCRDNCRKKLSMEPENHSLRVEPENQSFHTEPENHSFHMEPENHSLHVEPENHSFHKERKNHSFQMEPENHSSRNHSLHVEPENHSFHVEKSASQILDLLENPLSSKFNSSLESDAEALRTTETDEGSPIISDVWDGFEDYQPLMPPRLSEARKSWMAAKSPDTVISISSTSISQNTASPDVTVRERVLDDSMDAFQGIDLSGLERAALAAYAKVVSPLPTPPPPVVATPVNQRPPQENAVTPMADYSIMESPALERELDKYGIRRLRRNQAKLILRHIYNELHPLVPATPAATNSHATPVRNSHASPVSRRGQARAPRARGRRGGATVSRGRKVHDMSLSQPDPDRGDDTERQHNTSLSQPLVGDSRSSESDSSASSSGESGGEEGDDLSDLDEDGLERPGKLESAQEVRETMSRLIVAEPELHHRLLMYEPVMLVELQALLKRNGQRCNPRLLLDYLDEHCITFRTPRPPRTGRQGTQRRKRSPRKASQRGTRGRRAKPAAGPAIG